MPPDGRIGFQTNGLLLTGIKMHDLVQAGLDRISFSVDAMEPDLLEQVRTGAKLKGIEEALKISSRYKKAVPGRPLEVGIEYVLQKDNLENLPATLRWAAARGADFALVSHMLAYDENMKDQSVFDRSTDEAVAHYQEWCRKAEIEGLNPGEYFGVLWKYIKTGDEQKLVDFVGRMVQDASDKDIFFNLKNLLERDNQLDTRLKSIFEEAGIAAQESGLNLSLPALSPRFNRRCEFIEEGGAFVSWDGFIHPCYFLWHTYSCFVTEWQKYVNAQKFGTVTKESLTSIWNKPEFVDFRSTVMMYDYPFCTNCTLAPCDYIDAETFEQDCYTNTIPCGDCQWCLGLFQCL
jgi:putative metalloenzyme radical SAM/SPASM domain maturase